MIELCVSYLRNFLQLIHTPAFQSYVWFCRTNSAPLQSTFLILTYLQDHRGTAAEAQALYMVHEVIDFFVDESDNNPSTDARNEMNANTEPGSKQVDPAWKTLKALLRRVETLSQNRQPQKLSRNAGYRTNDPSVTVGRQSPLTQAAPSPNPSLASQSPRLFAQAFPSISSLNRTDHGGGATADTSDLDIWPFSLLQTPDSSNSRAQTHRAEGDQLSSNRNSKASGHEPDGSRSGSGQAGTISPFQILSESRKEHRGMERSLGFSRDGEVQTYGQGRSPWDSLENSSRSTAPDHPDQFSNGPMVNNNVSAMKEHLNDDLDMLVNEDLWMDS